MKKWTIKRRFNVLNRYVGHPTGFLTLDLISAQWTSFSTPKPPLKPAENGSRFSLTETTTKLTILFRAAFCFSADSSMQNAGDSRTSSFEFRADISNLLPAVTTAMSSNSSNEQLLAEGCIFSGSKRCDLHLIRSIGKHSLHSTLLLTAGIEFTGNRQAKWDLDASWQFLCLICLVTKEGVWPPFLTPSWEETVVTSQDIRYSLTQWRPSTSHHINGKTNANSKINRPNKTK